MSYKLEKPYTDTQRADFIAEYNHIQGLEIAETELALFALKKNEIMQNDEPIVDPDYEQKEALKEAERLAKLYLTAADVERAIYKAKGMDFEDIIELVTQMQPEGLDIKALKIELKANNFYRGNQYINVIGSILGFTPKMLDEFFKTNDYTKLIEA